VCTELGAIITKELRQTFRDRRMLMVLFLSPVLQLTLFGFAVNLDVDHLATVVRDDDRSQTSRSILRGMVADPTLHVVGKVEDPVSAIRGGEASVGLIFPHGLERKLVHGSPAEVQVLVDGTDPIVATTAIDTATRYLQREAARIVARRRDSTHVTAAPTLGAAPRPRRILPAIRAEPHIYYNPRLKSAVYMVPGVLATVLLVVTTVITAMSIARERELGTIEQLMVAPMRPAVLLLGKILPFAAIGMVTAGVVLAVGTILFDVPVRGPLLVLVIGTALYLMSTLGMGVLISTMARSQQQAILGGFFFIMPSIMLSGFISPIANMPEIIRLTTYGNPVRYYVEILRGNLLKSAGFADLAFQLIALAVFGAAILGIASLRFHKRMG